MSLEAAPLDTKIQVPAKQPDSPWRVAIRRFTRNRLALIGLFILIIMILICVFGPMFSPYNMLETNIRNKNLPPSAEHWLGTDKLGRDVLLRLMLAGRISLTVGLVATGISVAIGATLGALAGFYRKGVDTVIMRTADIFMALPSLPIMIIMGAILSDLKVDPADRIYFLMLILGILAWSGLARLVRGQILTLREQE